MYVLVLIGTRPEAIKMAPVVLALRQSSILTPVVCSTGQHREMLDAVLGDFGITPDRELSVMQSNQTLTGLAGRVLLRLEETLREVDPACILVQGDTVTACMGAMSGFYSRVPVAHVEAGLRSGDMYAPYPEEFNRKVAALATTWHFAPTKKSAANLLSEGIAKKSIYITGNTVVDALLYMRKEVRKNPPQLVDAVERVLASKSPYVLITGHRRENFGQGMEDMCEAITRLARSHPEYHFIYPVHLNPNVKGIVEQRLAGMDNIILTAPCAYKPFLRLLDNCVFVMSDSGGVQEEAPSLGKQVLVMREVTERPEGVEAGFCHLVGTDVEKIVSKANTLMQGSAQAPVAANPYGDGHASEKIVQLLEQSVSE